MNTFSKLLIVQIFLKMSRKKLLRFKIRLFFWWSVDPVREQENVVMPNRDTVAPVWEHMQKSLIQNGIHAFCSSQT